MLPPEALPYNNHLSDSLLTLITVVLDGMEEKGEQSSRTNLQVVVRVRPLSSNEKERKDFQCVFPLDKKVKLSNWIITYKYSVCYSLIPKSTRIIYCVKIDNTNDSLFSMPLLVLHLLR